jgi:potassium-transporting ATPase KdpC subunit
MLASLRATLVLLLGLTFLTGVIYPGIVTLVAQTAFVYQANGSMFHAGDRIIGSEWIGQPFSKPGYFWGRLSGTQPFPYNAASSSGSNLGPLHPDLQAAAKARIASLEQDAATSQDIAAQKDAAQKDSASAFPQDAVEKKPIPVDLATASGSGLDPHISPAAAEFQLTRVAAARQLSEDRVRALVRQYTEGRQLGVLGEPRVNVLRLNAALDQQSLDQQSEVPRNTP